MALPSPRSVIVAHRDCLMARHARWLPGRCLAIVAFVLLAGTLLGCGQVGAAPAPPWQLLGHSDDLSSLAFRDASHGWAVGSGHATFLETSDGGRTWRSAQGRITPDTKVGSLPATLASLALPAQVLSAGHTLFATTYGRAPSGAAATAATPSLVLRSDDGNASWHVLLSLARGDSVIYLAASDARHLWALCAPGRPDAPGPTYLLRSTDGGQRWTRLAGYGVFTAGGIGIQTPLLFADARHGWSLYRRYEGAAWSVFRRTTDGGASWQRNAQPQVELSRCLAALGASRIWVGGDGRSVAGKPVGVLVSSSDGGRTWRREANFPDASVSAVSFVDASDGWLVTSRPEGGGAIYATRDGGRTWRRELSSSADEWRGQWMFQRAGRRLLASNGFLFYARSLPHMVP